MTNFHFFRLVAIGLALCVAAPKSLPAQVAGSIAGVVLDETKKPVQYAFVTYTHTVFRAGDTGPFGDGMLTGADGKFAFAKVEPGIYFLCVSTGPTRGYINTCEWNTSPPQAVVKTGQAVSGIFLDIVHGAKIRVRVDDSSKLIEANKDSSHMLPSFGFFTKDGIYHRPQILSQDASGYDFIMNAPHNADLRFQVRSRDFEVLDDKGASLRAAPALAFQVKPGDPERVVKVRVSSVTR